MAVSRGCIRHQKVRLATGHVGQHAPGAGDGRLYHQHQCHHHHHHLRPAPPLHHLRCTHKSTIREVCMFTSDVELLKCCKNTARCLCMCKIHLPCLQPNHTIRQRYEQLQHIRLAQLVCVCVFAARFASCPSVACCLALSLGV